MIKRFLELNRLIHEKKSFFIFGARGTGKTALLSTLKKTDVHIFDLLQSRSYQRYLSDMGLFAEEVEALLDQRTSKLSIIAVDEIQKLPDLLDEIHRLIELYPNQVLFILTGSSARKLKRGGANLLAGRALTYSLFPISSIEDKIDISKALHLGTLPIILSVSDKTAVKTLEVYVNTYLREEILEESLVRQIDRFARFLDLAAQLNSEPVNFAKLGRSLKTTGQTIQEYFSILEDTLLAYRVGGWEHSIKKQLMQAPKFYWFDCGVLNAITGDLRSDLKPSHYRFGKLFETWIVSELHRYNHYLDLGLRFHYWRDKNGREVDIVVSRGLSAPLAAIEIKSAEAPFMEDVEGLSLIEEDYPHISKWCFCRTPKRYSRHGITFFPWQEGLLQLKKL